MNQAFMEINRIHLLVKINYTKLTQTSICYVSSFYFDVHPSAKKCIPPPEGKMLFYFVLDLGIQKLTHEKNWFSRFSFSFCVFLVPIQNKTVFSHQALVYIFLHSGVHYPCFNIYECQKKNRTTLKESFHYSVSPGTKKTSEFSQTRKKNGKAFFI